MVYRDVMAQYVGAGHCAILKLALAHSVVRYAATSALETRSSVQRDERAGVTVKMSQCPAST